MRVDFLDRRVLAKRVVDDRKPASGHESQLRQGVASGHPQGRSAAKKPQSGLTRRNPLTFNPTCCGFSHSLFAIYARFYAAVNTLSRSALTRSPGTVRVLPIKSSMVSKVRNGLSLPFWVMWYKKRVLNVAPLRGARWEVADVNAQADLATKLLLYALSDGTAIPVADGRFAASA